MAKKSTTKNEKELPYSTVNNLLDKLSSLKNFRSSKKFYIILVALILVALVIYKKNWFVAATINGSPITNLELQMRLNREFRSQTLNQLINEKIILNEAVKNNAVVSEAEINKKISEIETNVGGTDALNALLSQQGQTKDSLRQQIKLQLAIEKLYSKDATTSAEEVEKFVASNKAQLRATDSAGQTKEAADLLKQQKLSQIFSQKFQELRQNAQIKIF